MGYRIEDFVPYITYADLKEDDNNLALIQKRHTESLGIRYDFHPNITFKLEYAKVFDQSDDLLPGLFGNAEFVGFAVDFIY